MLGLNLIDWFNEIMSLRSDKQVNQLLPSSLLPGEGLRFVFGPPETCSATSF